MNRANDEATVSKLLAAADVRAVLDSDELMCNVDVVAAGVGMTKWSYYEAVKRGDAPIMPIKVGRRQRYRIADLRRLLLGADAGGGPVVSAGLVEIASAAAGAGE